MKSIFSVISGIVKLRGATTNALIGNVSDRLKVDASISSEPSPTILADSYSFGSDIVANNSGIDNPLILFRNPTGSGKIIYVWRLMIGSEINNVNMTGKLFSSPTITSTGSMINAYGRNIGGSQPAPIAQIYSLPVLSTLGNYIDNVNLGQNTLSIKMVEDYSIAIQPGNSLVVVSNPASNNRLVSVSMIWKEV